MAYPWRERSGEFTANVASLLELSVARAHQFANSSDSGNFFIASKRDSRCDNAHGRSYKNFCESGSCVFASQKLGNGFCFGCGELVWMVMG